MKIGDILWVPTKNGTEIYYTEDNNTTNTNVTKEKTRPSYWEGKVTAIVKSANGLAIWEKFEGGVLKTKLGDINQGSQFTFNSTEVKTIIHEMQETLIAECTPIGTFKFRSNGEQPKGTFWTKVDKNSITRTKVEPLVFDTVVPCNTKIIAGEPLGYLGTYETPSKDGDTKTKKQVHVEVFTPNLATVEFLLNNPFKLTGRKYIKIPKGTILKGEVPISSEIKAFTLDKIDFPGIPSDSKQQDYGFGKGTVLDNTTASQAIKPTTAPAKTTATTTHTTTLATTTATQTSTEPKQEPLPDYTTTQDHYFAVDKLTVVKNQRIVETGTGKEKKIEVVAGKDDYYEIGVEKHTGYLKKEDMKGKEIDQHEWAKLGFQLVQEANPKSDGYLDPKLMPAVFQQIYSKIDTDKDGKLQSEELKTALQNEEIRDQWSKLIAYHPSEWQLDTRSILARFGQLLTNPSAPADKILHAQALLAHETQKINGLTFLEQVAPPISPTPMLYHFHPVAFIEYFSGGVGKKLIWMQRVIKRYGNEVAEKFRQRMFVMEKNLQIDPNYIMACMALETGRTFNSAIKNPGASATGLIQFMKNTAIALGTTTQALATMGPVAQLEYVEKYFVMTAKNIKVPTEKWLLEDVYYAIFTPAIIKMKLDDVVYSSGSEAYNKNKGHDRNKDGNITKREIAENIRIFYSEGFKEEG